MNLLNPVIASISYRSGSTEIANMRVPLYDATSDNYEDIAMEFAESNFSVMKRCTTVVFRFTGGIDGHLMWVL